MYTDAGEVFGTVVGQTAEGKDIYDYTSELEDLKDYLVVDEIGRVHITDFKGFAASLNLTVGTAAYEAAYNSYLESIIQ